MLDPLSAMSLGGIAVKTLGNVAVNLSTPKVPKPKYVDFKKYNNYINYTPQLNQITDSTRAYATSLRNSGVGAGVEASNLAAIRGQEVGERNNIFAHKANYEAETANKNVDLSNQETSINTGLDNKYNEDVYAREVGMLSNFSSILDSGISDSVGVLGNQRMLDMLKNSFPDVYHNIQANGNKTENANKTENPTNSSTTLEGGGVAAPSTINSISNLTPAQKGLVDGNVDIAAIAATPEYQAYAAERPKPIGMSDEVYNDKILKDFIASLK